MFNTKKVLSAVAAATLSVSAFSAATIAQAVTTEAAAAETVVAQGSWTKKSFKSAGTWSIVEKDGAMYVELSDDFKTRNAPDLKIFLSPTAASAANGKNATDGSVLIAPLSSNKGGQSYPIPAGVDLASYSSILIHCEAYSKLWSASDL
ncbi:MAG: DM13 domain-containing protein [Pseudomonadota bacterium]